MHEFSITSQIVQTVLAEAEKQKAKKALEVHLVIGKLTLLGIAQVRFSYNLLVKGTLLEGSSLLIERKKAKVQCDQCGYKGPIKVVNDSISHFSFPTLACPTCRASVRIIEGRECLIKSIKLAI